MTTKASRSLPVLLSVIAAVCWQIGESQAQDYQYPSADLVQQTRLRAIAGEAIYQNNFGVYLERGRGVAQDETEAVAWYLKAAKAGLAPAQYNLASCLMKGTGTAKDLPMAIHWFTKAALSGHAGSQVEMGLASSRGTGLPKDDREAVRWFRMAAESGYDSACYHLYVCYSKGEGVDKDQTKAVEWLRKAAVLEHAGAQFDLAFAYAEGVGVPKNEQAALYWSRKGAENGDTRAQHNLAFYLSEGIGGEKNRQEALMWYRKAAVAGLCDSQNNLGYAFQIGEGLPKNLIEAYAWTSLSAAQGYKNAIEEMPNLEKLVTPSERVRALERARQIKAKIDAQEDVPELDIAPAPIVSQPKSTPPSSLEPKVERRNDSPDRNAIVSHAGGTGYFITDAGHVLTCAHVIDGAKHVWIQMGTAEPRAVTIAKVDAKNDLALLALVDAGSVQAKPLPLARQGSKLGEAVFTIGFPNPDIQGLSPKVTDGRINSLAGIEDDPTAYQISVALQPGNSGGPLINMRGEVVGTSQSILSGVKMFKAGAEIPQNVSYAVKIGQANSLVDGLGLKVVGGTRDKEQSGDLLPSLIEAALPSVVLVLVE